jgi:hypothetical protein
MRVESLLHLITSRFRRFDVTAVPFPGEVVYLVILGEHAPRSYVHLVSARLVGQDGAPISDRFEAVFGLSIAVG